MNIILPVSRRRYAMIALAVLLTAPALAAAPELPPLNDPPTHARLPGKFVWVDLLTPDVERAETFYGKLFGWSFRKIGEGESAYTLAFLGEEPMAGIVRVPAKAGARPQARWIGFISVPDVRAAERQVSSRAAKYWSARGAFRSAAIWLFSPIAMVRNSGLDMGAIVESRRREGCRLFTLP